jgi:hypothetical protein
MKSTREFLFDVRWFLKYCDGKTARGFWNKGARELSSYDQPTEGLYSVGIEANDKKKNIIKTVVEWPAYRFKWFQWEVTTNIPALTLKNFKDKLTLVPFHEGLTIIDHSGSSETFFIDGTHQKLNAKGIAENG